MDILDVWFDSGSTQFAVLKNKEYFRKYQNTNKIYLIGLIMDTEKRRVKEMAFELLDN